MYDQPGARQTLTGSPFGRQHDDNAFMDGMTNSCSSFTTLEDVWERRRYSPYAPDSPSGRYSITELEPEYPINPSGGTSSSGRCDVYSFGTFRTVACPLRFLLARVLQLLFPDTFPLIPGIWSCCIMRHNTPVSCHWPGASFFRVRYNIGNCFLFLPSLLLLGCSSICSSPVSISNKPLCVHHY